MKRRSFTLKIHPAGLAVFIAAFLLWDSHFVLASAAALLLHEGAHLITMWLCGMRECTVELTPFGGMADAKAFDSYSPWKRMVSSAAGVLASGAAAYGCLILAPRTVFWEALFQSNLSLALLNSLPAWPLDGARVLAAMAGYAGCEAGVKKLLSWVTRLIGVGFVLTGLYGIWHGMINPSLLVIGPYLCYAARAESVSERVRRLNGAGRKLDSNAIVPVTVWAGGADASPDQFGVLLGRMQNDRYHLLLRIDQKSGAIQKCWTENEMLNHSIGDGRI